MTSNFTPTLHRNCPGKGLQQTLYCHIQNSLFSPHFTVWRIWKGSFFTPSILSCQVTLPPRSPCLSWGLLSVARPVSAPALAATCHHHALMASPLWPNPSHYFNYALTSSLCFQPRLPDTWTGNRYLTVKSWTTSFSSPSLPLLQFISVYDRPETLVPP